MTEAEWLSCGDPGTLLEELHSRFRPLSPRKLRLLAVACCRHVFFPGIELEVPHAIDVLERVADGLALPEELRVVHGEVHGVWGEDLGDNRAIGATVAATTLDGLSPFRTSLNVLAYAESAATLGAGAGSQVGERLVQCSLIHDIFPSPFRPIFLRQSWFAWANHTPRWLAQTIYDQRAFDRLPILGDALEEGGCTEATILEHLRGSGPHVRGCWLLDLLLGKE